MIEVFAHDHTALPSLHGDLLLRGPLPALGRQFERPLHGGVVAVDDDTSDRRAVDLDIADEVLLARAVGRFADALIDAIWTLHEDRELLARMGAAARSRVESDFTVPTMMDNMERIYLDVLEREAS